jgi:uncharacterized protein (TIGR03437 family)
MKTLRLFVPFVMVTAMAWADISGTISVPVGSSLSLDTGAIVATGSGDILFSGISLNPASFALIYNYGQVGSMEFVSLTALAISNLFPMYSATPLTIGQLTPNDVFLVYTNGGHYAKVLVTASSGSSIVLQYVTYGASGSGGGNVPTITAVENNYGQVPQGLPNYGIAPGSLFFITGTSLAGTTTGLQSSASPGLQTTLNSVSVSVTVGGSTVNCPLYYLSPTQIDAVLPGNTPVGTGTIIVSYNGAMSTAAPIVVVQSAFGVLSYNGTLAATYDGNNSLITGTNAANPGQTIVIYGSGVGDDPNDDDKVFPQGQHNLTGIPMQVYVGGVLATVLYRGRSQFPGVDQINITIPSGVPTGCYVSLAVVSGNPSIVSNGATIPVAASGKTCSDPNSMFSPGLIQTLSGQSTVRLGSLSVRQTTSIGAGTNIVSNNLSGVFQSVSGTNYATGVGGNFVSVGSCLVTNSSFNGYTATSTSLDAGPSITVTGPQGSLGLTPITFAGQTLKTYSATSVPTNFIPATGGPFTFDNGSGGADIGHFNTTTTSPTSFTWTNPSAVTVITRGSGVTVTWSGGAPGVTVTIIGSSSALVNGQTVTGSFTCVAPLSVQQFTVPAPVLLALPAGSGNLALQDSTAPQGFPATGLDVGYVSSAAAFTENVQYN